MDVNGQESYSALGLYETKYLASQWETYTFVFRATDSSPANGSRLDLETPTASTLNRPVFYVDNVLIEEVSANYTVPTGGSAIVINPTLSELPKDCPDAVTNPSKCSQYVSFTDGTLVSWPITVAAMGSEIVVWDSNPFMDTDRDKVADLDDLCPETLAGSPVNENGCSFTQQRSSDLRVTLSSPLSVVVGDDIIYVITVYNAGPQQATNVATNGSLPSCALGIIPSGGSAACTHSVVTTAVGMLEQTVSISASEPDTNTSNNSSTVSTNVQGALSVGKTGTGAGIVTSDPAGIDCGADCTEAYDVNTQVTLTPTPDANSLFGGWGGNCTGSSTSCTVTLDANKSVTAIFNPASLPDLVHQALTVSTSTASKLTIKDRIKNQGTATANASTISYYLSLDNVYQNGADTFVCSRPLASIVAGVSIPTGTSVTTTTCPRPVVPYGTIYRLLAVDDSAGVVTESNESNNVFVSTGNALSLGADLASTAMTATKSGNTLTLKDRAKNQGNMPAGSFKVGFYVSADTVFGVGDVFICDRTIDSLGVGAADPASGTTTSGTATTTCSAPPMPPGTYYVLAVDDYKNDVIESSETNNVRATTGKLSW
jgi:uncharacterized repeat protein (TIGR01451 family)